MVDNRPRKPYVTFTAMRSVIGYFDGSNQSADGKDSLLLVGGVAASLEVWNEFNSTWNEALRSFDPPMEYVHMRELAHLKGRFREEAGWSRDRSYEVIPYIAERALSVLHTGGATTFHGYVNTTARSELVGHGHSVPEPQRILACYGVSTLFDQHRIHFGEADCYKPLFDQKEKFLHQTMKMWTEGKRCRKNPKLWSNFACFQENKWLWEKLEQPKSVDMKLTPGLQVADIVAWALNRRESGNASGPWAQVADQLVGRRDLQGFFNTSGFPLSRQVLYEKHCRCSQA